MQKRLTRSEVPQELTWDLDDLFPNRDAWEKELKALTADMAQMAKYQGRLGDGARVFLECVQTQESLTARLMRVGSYAWLQMSVDGTNQECQIAAGRVGALNARFQAGTAFVRSEALALPEGTLERYLDEEPEMASLRPVIERMIEEKPHMLQPETETALAALSEVLNAPSTVYRLSKTADMSFEDVVDGDGNQVPMSFAGYEGRYETSSDAVLRRNAFASFTKGLKAYQNTYGATWGTEVKKNVEMAKLRGFDSAVDMMLSSHQISSEIYNNLHDIILTELAPHMRRYAQLRKKILGLDKMLYCDIEAPLDPDFSPETTYEEASKVILGGLEVLGSEYSEIIDEGLKNRWIDLADNVGKSTGAFCNSVYGVHPYILITWTQNMRDALVLSHELGHAGHGVMSQRYQRLANCRPSMFFIEAPSTINEILVFNHILDQTGDTRMRRWLTMQVLMTYHHNMVRHLIEGELQRRIYALAEKGQPINAGILSRVQGEILDEFWAGEVEVDEGARLTWMRQPHYYMGLYPYTYSAGLTVGTSVAKAIREEGQPAVDRWLRVLKAGGTKKPVDLAEMAGVDMKKPDVIRDVVSYVGSLVDEVVASF